VSIEKYNSVLNLCFYSTVTHPTNCTVYCVEHSRVSRNSFNSAVEKHLCGTLLTLRKRKSV